MVLFQILESLRFLSGGEISLNLCLIDAIDGNPRKESSNQQSPECMTHTKIGVEVKNFNSSTVIIPAPDYICASDVIVALDDDGEEASKHADGLEDICPHDRLDTAYGSVENTNSKDHKTSNVQIKSSNLQNLNKFIVEPQLC